MCLALSSASCFDSLTSSNFAPNRFSGRRRRSRCLCLKSLMMSSSHQAPALTFQTRQTLYFHPTPLPSFSQLPASQTANQHLKMAVVSFGHVNTGFQGFLFAQDACRKPERSKFPQEIFRNRQGELQRP